MVFSDLHSELKELVDRGLDVRKSWHTVLFHANGTSVNAGFKHKHYGYQFTKKDVESAFHKHVVSDPTYWFRGSGSRDRAIAREHQLRENVPVSLSAVQVHQSLVMAHDVSMPIGVEGGPKDFFLASPWQILNTLSKEGGDVDKTKRSISSQKGISSPKGPYFKPEWKEDGQPLAPWPCCSMYNSRCDANVGVSDDKREYFFTIDLDGKHCCDEESLAAKDCCAVINTFERTVEGAPGILRVIGETMKQAFSELEMPVNVSWHKSIGWKPSWRGYVVGAFFKNPSDAKIFVRDFVMPKLMSEQNNAWYSEGLFDLSSYGVGLDRCIGSAKLITANPNDMRFLNPSPLEGVSDQSLVDIFHKCPNEYLLTVLGWIYPQYTANPTPHLKLVRVPQSSAAARPKRKNGSLQSATPFKSQRDSEYGEFTKLSQQDANALEALIGASLEQAGFAQGWKGKLAVRGTYKGKPFFDMNAEGASCFCVYRECDGKVGFPSLPTRKADATPHSKVDKLKFRVIVSGEKGDPLKRLWLRQNCFACNNKLTRVCPIDGDHAQKVFQQLLAIAVKPEASPTNRRALMPLQVNSVNDLSRFVMNLTVVKGSGEVLLKNL